MGPKRHHAGCQRKPEAQDAAGCVTFSTFFTSLRMPNPDTISQLLPYIEDYPESLFHTPQYVPAGMKGHVNVVPPA